MSSCFLYQRDIFLLCGYVPLWLGGGCGIVPAVGARVPRQQGTPGGSRALHSHLLEGGNGNPFQYSCLENSMDREAWLCNHGVAKSWTQLSD